MLVHKLVKRVVKLPASRDVWVAHCRLEIYVYCLSDKL